MLGIDLSLQHTGLCVLTKTGVVMRTMTIDYVFSGRKKGDPPIAQAEIVQRLLGICNEIIQVIKDFKVMHVGIEGFAHDAKWQAHQIGEVAGALKTQLYLACKLVAEVVAPGAARKHVLGYGGRLSKEVITEAVREGLEIDVANDHEADAAVVARYTFDWVVAKEKEIQELWQKSKVKPKSM